MSKQVNNDLEGVIMSKVNAGQITMKPKWYFAIGSFLMIGGVTGLSVVAVFLTNLTLFLLRRHGPGTGRLQVVFETFPLWVPLLAITGIVSGITLLKKYDFSYKKNFFMILLGFILSIVISGWLIDRLGFNEILLRQGRMKRLYQQLDKQGTNSLKPLKSVFNY